MHTQKHEGIGSHGNRAGVRLCSGFVPVTNGRQDSVTTGSYLASGLSGSNSAASLQESTRTRCPQRPDDVFIGYGRLLILYLPLT
jgi:hypothetical protein